MAHKTDADWTPNYEELKDILRPMMAADDKTKAEEAPPQGGAMELGDRLWAEKVAQEDREQQQLDQLLRRRMKLRREGQQRKGLGGLQQLRSNRWMVLFRNYMPYGLLLLLAPFVSSRIDFLGSAGQVMFSLPYAAVLLLTALPLLLLWLWLQPMGDPPFFQLAALCLPLEFYFLLLVYRSAGGMLLIVAVLLVLGILLFRLVDHRKHLAPEQKTSHHGEEEPLNAAMVEEAIRRKRVKDLRRDEERKLDKAQHRKLLRFGVRYAAGLFALFIAGGAVLQAPAFLAATPQDHTLPAAALAEAERAGAPLPFSIEGVIGEIAMLSPVRWGDLSQEQRESAMQALLNAELDNLSLAPTPIDDKEIHTLKAKNKLNIKQALKSNKNKLNERIQAVCYAAYCKKLLTIASTVDLKTYEADAMAYVERRCDYYTVLIAQHWVDGVGENVVE